MSDSQHFDDFLKQSFDRYTPSVPDDMWDKIRKKQKDKRPGGFWWISTTGRTAALIIAGLLSVVTATVIYKNVTSKNQSLTTTPSGQKNTAAPTPSSNSTGSNPTPTGTASAGVTDTNAQDWSNSDTSISDISNVSSTDGQRSLANTTAEPVSVDRLAKQKTNNVRQKAITLKKSMRLSVGNADSEDGINDAFADDDPKFVVVGEQAFQLNRQPYDATKISAASLAQKKTIVPFKNITVPCPTVEKDAAGNKKYIEFYAGPDYGIRSFSDTANSTFLLRRKESIKFTSAFSVGLRYTKVFSNGVSFRTGFNFSQINEKFSFAESNTTQVTYITDASTGDTTGSYIVRGTRYKTSINRYRTLDIPVLIGYELGNGRLHANINAGAIINLRNWQKGSVLDTTYKPVSISEQSPYQYKTNLGIGFTAGVSLYYKLNDQFHLLAEPYLRYNFSPMSKDALTLKEKYTTLGLRLGLRFDLP